MTADFTKEAEADAPFKQPIDVFSTIDVVLHAASSIVEGPVGDLNADAWFNDFEEKPISSPTSLSRL